MPDFRLVAPFEPTGDQPQAIDRLVEGLSRGLRHQTLLGVTGSGKSLPPDQTVLIGREAVDGSIEWRLRPIGEVVDEALEQGTTRIDPAGTEVAGADGRPAAFVVTVDPATHRSLTAPVSAFTRHVSPRQLWEVETNDGRRVTVTGDHNFVRLGGDGRLELAETTSLQSGDWLPLPDRVAAPADQLTRLDAWDVVDPGTAWVAGPAILDELAPWNSRRLLATGCRAPLATLDRDRVQVLERHGSTIVGGRKGRHTLPASWALTPSYLEFLGLFAAEGHVAARYATITPGPGAEALATDRLDAAGIAWFARGDGELGIPSRIVADHLRVVCGHQAEAKHLPPFWPQLGDKHLGHLLAGYFEGDGWVEPAAVAAVTKSERLVSEIAYALLRFGIVGRIEPHVEAGGRDRPWR